MNRTAQQRTRRRRLADAASGIHEEPRSGGVGRARVVLFACVSARVADTTPSQMLKALSRYAMARDWHVAAEILDEHLGEVPVTSRPTWRFVADLIESGLAEGVVTNAPPIEGDALDTWLTAHDAFVSRMSSQQTRATAATALGHGQPVE